MWPFSRKSGNDGGYTPTMIKDRNGIAAICKGDELHGALYELVYGSEGAKYRPLNMGDLNKFYKPNGSNGAIDGAIVIAYFPEGVPEEMNIGDGSYLHSIIYGATVTDTGRAILVSGNTHGVYRGTHGGKPVVCVVTGTPQRYITKAREQYKLDVGVIMSHAEDIENRSK